MIPKLLSSSSIIGSSIKNAIGEDIGDIKELMIDWKRGSVAYAVMSFGGFMGFSEKLFAVPLESFEFDTADTKERIMLNVDKEVLENAPGFDKDNWPQHLDYTYIDSIYAHYGRAPYSARKAEVVM